MKVNEELDLNFRKNEMNIKNGYEISGDITAVFIESPKYGHFEVLIDTDDLCKISKYNAWFVFYSRNSQGFYAQAHYKLNGKIKSIQMHRLIMNPEYGELVDHINHDTLDNKKKNLRIVTNAENMQNRLGSNRNNKSSNYRGVSWNKRAQKWEAYTMLNTKRKYLGLFNNELDAARATSEARRKLMPYSEMDKMYG
jgi:hypothetical protein